MRTEELTAGRFRVYAPGAIPYWALSSKYFLKLIGTTFQFEQFQPVQAEGEKRAPGLLFGRGRYPGADPATPATIESLRVSLDHIDLLTRSTGGHAFSDGVLTELGKVCAEVAPEHGEWMERFRVEMFQTVWVGQLDLSPEDLIEPRVRGALFTTLEGSGNEYGARKVYPKGLALRISTPAPRADLVELGLQFTDDEFKLEPRAGRLASERTWFSTSPLRSEDHLRLLEEVESAYRR